MRRLRELQMMAGLGRSRAERMAERQIKKFRRQVAERDAAMLLMDKIREREHGAQGMKPMPYARKPQ